MSKMKWLAFSILFLASAKSNSQITPVTPAALKGIWFNEADVRSKFAFGDKHAYQIYNKDTAFSYVYLIKDTLIIQPTQYLFLYSKEDTSCFEILGLTGKGLSLFSEGEGKRYFYYKGK